MAAGVETLKSVETTESKEPIESFDFSRYCIKNEELILELKTDTARLKTAADYIREVFEEIKYVVYGKKWCDISDEEVVFTNYLENPSIFEMIGYILKTRVQKDMNDIISEVCQSVMIANLIGQEKLKEILIGMIMEKYEKFGLFSEETVRMMSRPIRYEGMDWSGIYEKVLMFQVENGFYDFDE